MERLTKRTNNNKLVILKGSSCSYSAHSFDCQTNEGREKIKTALDKLATYEDLEEQGLLLKLPVPLGTIVYCIYTSMTGKNATIFSNCFNAEMRNVWGISVFATKEEAENRLEELRSGQNK
nr:hypothetical protein [uncultured Lachnoclostridium sp.]